MNGQEIYCHIAKPMKLNRIWYKLVNNVQKNTGAIISVTKCISVCGVVVGE